MFNGYDDQKMMKNEEIPLPDSDTLLPFNDICMDSLQYYADNDNFAIEIQFDEDTLDIGGVNCMNPQSEYIPVTPHGPPERNNFSGEYNFAVEIDGSHTRKKKYLYSHRLNRIYVDMLCNFSVGFNWDSVKLAGQPMYVRATTVFSDLAQAEKRVERCFQHSHESSNAVNLSPMVIKNVLRSAREMGTQDVFYCGQPELADSWYSVLVRLSKPTEHAYNFVCKNSCSSGINRRAIDIIFTLENAMGVVFGRQSVGARVCSCPRRDILRDEEDGEVHKGKRLAAPREDKSKKIRIEVVAKSDVNATSEMKNKKHLRVDKQDTDVEDDTMVTLPAMEIVGVKAAVLGLKVSLTMMEQARSYKSIIQKPTDSIDRCITNLKLLIENLESSLTVKANPP